MVISIEKKKQTKEKPHLTELSITIDTAPRKQGRKFLLSEHNKETLTKNKQTKNLNTHRPACCQLLLNLTPEAVVRQKKTQSFTVERDDKTVIVWSFM